MPGEGSSVRGEGGGMVSFRGERGGVKDLSQRGRWKGKS